MKGHVMRIGITFAFTALLSQGFACGAPAAVDRSEGSSSGGTQAEASASVAWPQWGGPTRDFKVSAKGLAKEWPKGGPPTLWSRPLGEGHSAICVDGDTLFTMYSQGEQEVVIAAAVATGKTLWEHRY